MEIPRENPDAQADNVQADGAQSPLFNPTELLAAAKQTPANTAPSDLQDVRVAQAQDSDNSPPAPTQLDGRTLFHLTIMYKELPDGHMKDDLGKLLQEQERLHRPE